MFIDTRACAIGARDSKDVFSPPVISVALGTSLPDLSHPMPQGTANGHSHAFNASTQYIRGLMHLYIT